MDGDASNVFIDRVTINQAGGFGIEKNGGTLLGINITNSAISQPALAAL